VAPNSSPSGGRSSPGDRPADLARGLGIATAQPDSLIVKASAEKLMIVKNGNGYAVNC
jgi:hypothetical protein